MQFGAAAGQTIRLSDKTPTSNYADSPIRDRGNNHEMLIAKDIEFDHKLLSVFRNLHDIYFQLKSNIFDEISRSMGVDPISILEKEKKPVDFEALIHAMRYFVTRLIKYHNSVKDINERKRERTGLTFGNEELLPLLEADLKTSNREQEKLKLLLETAQLKISHLEKKNEELLSQQKRISSDAQSEKSKLRTQIKSQGEQLKLLQEENIVMKRPTTGSSSVKKIKDIKAQRENLYSRERDTFDRVSFEGMQTTKSANSVMFENIKQIQTQMDQNKLHNLQTKQDLKEFRRKTEQERDKELTSKQKDLMLSRLTIQVEEREKDIHRLKSDYDRVFQDLKKMKEKESEREREEWAKEVLSDRNPNTLALYKKKIEEKDVQIAGLKKQLRKYAISEKKVFIKEKAFELERSEYQDRMVYLHDRVSKLSRINDDLKKAGNDGLIRDKFRKKRETNLNRSQTSSDDNTEVRPGLGSNFESSGIVAESFGKTPKKK